MLRPAKAFTPVLKMLPLTGEVKKECLTHMGIFLHGKNLVNLFLTGNSVNRHLGKQCSTKEVLQKAAPYQSLYYLLAQCIPL